MGARARELTDGRETAGPSRGERDCGIERQGPTEPPERSGDALSQNRSPRCFRFPRAPVPELKPVLTIPG